MNETKTIDVYTHCGYTQKLKVREIEGWLGSRVNITLDHPNGGEPSELLLNPQQTEALEAHFVQRREQREKLAAEAFVSDPEEYPPLDNGGQEYGDD